MKVFNIYLQLLLLFTLCCSVVQAQKERNVWCFGWNCELDFNSGTPVEVQGSALSTVEGSASICDKNTGQLLFYTDGVSVWNRNNLKMPGDTSGLGGHSSSTQSAVIIPAPGSNHEYYVFCTDAEAGYLDTPGSANDSGAKYSIIDMNLRGGLGDIEQPPRKLVSPTCEKIAVALMPNQQDYWIVVHLWNSDAFYAYPLTATGIGTPVISHAGIVHHGTYYSNQSAIGYMRISPDGKKIAAAMDYELHAVQAFNFNNATGSISGPFLSDTSLSSGFPGFITGPYGLCFSPNSKFLYITAELDTNIYQYNLQAGNDSAILASRTAIAHTTDGNLPYSMQTGPDNKIYIDIYGTQAGYGQYIGSIDSPNVGGSRCHFAENTIYLQDGVCQVGLPEFPPMLPVSCAAAPVSIFADKTVFCSGDSVPVCAPSGYFAYQWSNNGTDSCTFAKSAGNYYVTATDNNGCTAESNHIAISTHKTPSVTVTVQGDTLTSFNAASYQWYLNDNPIPNATNEIYIAGQAGNYAVEITDTNGCIAKSSTILITGIENLDAEQFSVYPNPSAGSWQLVVDSKLLGNKLQILDDSGQLVSQSEISNLKSEITLPLPAGVYYLHISSNEISVVRKLVKL